MPNDNTAAWNTAAQLGSTAIGAMATGSINRKTRKWNEAMYARTRQDALDDWNRTNLYNLPENVMQRYKDAGLNPNLIYGSGTDATAGPVRSADVKPWNPQVPDFSNLGNVFSDFQSIQMKKNQTDLLAEQINQSKQQQQLTAAQVLKTMSETDRTKLGITTAQWDLMKDKSFYPFQLEALKLGNDLTGAKIGQTVTDTVFKLNENERQQLKNVSDLKTAVNIRQKLLQDIEESKSRVKLQGQSVSESSSRIKIQSQQLTNLKQMLTNSKMDEEIKRLIQAKLGNDLLDWADDDTWNALSEIIPVLSKRK